MADWSVLKERIAQKWQIPLFFLSLALLAGAFLRIGPRSTPPSIEDAEEFLGAMVSGGMYERAILAAHALLDEEKYTDVQRSPIHLALARAYSVQADVRREHTAAMGRIIVDHYQRATLSGSALEVGDFEKLGWACHWRRNYAAAAENLQKAIDGGSDDRLELLRHVISLGRYELDTPVQQLNEQIDRLIAETGEHRLDLCLWAIEQKLDALEATNRLEEAATLLVRNEERFRDSDLWDHYDYLKGLLLYQTGHYDEAETLLRAARNRVERGDEVHAMTGWLLGRVVLNDGGPQRPAEALSFFNDVMTYHPGGLYSLASRIGQAEAYALLERHDDAIGTYQIATEDLDTLRRNRLVSIDVLRTSMGVMAETLRQAGNARAAVEYARLAVTLVDRNNIEQTIMFLRQLARVLEIRADEIEAEAAAGGEEAFALEGATSEEARRLYAEAAATCLELAKFSIMNEGESADWSWQAAELYARSGDRARAVELFQSFAAEHPSHPLVARSILRVGQLNRALGNLPEAIEAYRECYRRFPRMLDGLRALVPLARAYLASGPGNEELAERTLDVVLADSEVLTPQAPEFADALFLLGEVLERRGEFERAIATLEEALERYPEDPRVWPANYFLAESSRRSALNLKAETAGATFAAQVQQIRAEAARRFSRARELYRALVVEYEVRGIDSLTRLEALFYRHAMLHEADCYFETGNYQQALKLYEDAAGVLKDSPSCLAAYVQIINSHVFLGQVDEARAALARARILVDAIPAETFAKSVSPETKEDWKRYFEWLGESELF